MFQEKTTIYKLYRKKIHIYKIYELSFKNMDKFIFRQK